MERTFACNLCEAMCGLRVTVDGAEVRGIRGDPDDVLSRGHICPKGPALKDLHDDPARLRQPVRRTAGGTWAPISWEEALDEVAAKLRAIRSREGPEAVAYYFGNPSVHGHRTALASQALGLALGTPNTFNPNSQDSNPRLFVCREMYGDALAMPVPDVDRTDHLLMLGANPAASNGSQMGLGDPRARITGIRRRGGKVVVVDPRRTETAAWCDAHVPIRPGGDAALLLAMMHVLFEAGRVDAERIDRTSTGASVLREIAGRFPPERVARAIDVPAARIRALALDLSGARTAAVYGRVGVCQSAFGPTASWLIEAINVLTGNFDREGGWMFPTPAADFGALGRVLIGDGFGRWRSRVRGLPELLGALPSAVMAEEMETPGEGQVRAFVCFAGNPVLTTPGGERLARALATLEHVVAIDYYVNETSRHAHVILPPAHVFEAGNFDLILLGLAVRNVARYSPPILAPAAGARDDWDIATDLAARIAIPHRGLSRLVHRLLRTLPERIVDLLLRLGPHHLTLAELAKHPHGLDLGPLVSSGGARVRTPDRKVHLAPKSLVADVARVERWLESPAPDLVLIGRRHMRSNNSWMNGLAGLSGGRPRDGALVHPSDAERLGVSDGTTAELATSSGRIAVRVEVTPDVKPGVVALAHGHGAPNANALTGASEVEPITGTSILGGLPVALRTP